MIRVYEDLNLEFFLGILGLFLDFGTFLRFCDFSFEISGLFLRFRNFFWDFGTFFGIFVRVYEDFLNCKPLGQMCRLLSFIATFFIIIIYSFP